MSKEAVTSSVFGPLLKRVSVNHPQRLVECIVGVVLPGLAFIGGWIDMLKFNFQGSLLNCSMDDNSLVHIFKNAADRCLATSAMYYHNHRNTSWKENPPYSHARRPRYTYYGLLDNVLLAVSLIPGIIFYVFRELNAQFPVMEEVVERLNNVPENLNKEQPADEKLTIVSEACGRDLQISLDIEWPRYGFKLDGLICAVYSRLLIFIVCFCIYISLPAIVGLPHDWNWLKYFVETGWFFGFVDEERYFRDGILNVDAWCDFVGNTLADKNKEPIHTLKCEMLGMVSHRYSLFFAGVYLANAAVLSLADILMITVYLHGFYATDLRIVMNTQIGKTGNIQATQEEIEEFINKLSFNGMYCLWLLESHLSARKFYLLVKAMFNQWKATRTAS